MKEKDFEQGDKVITPDGIGEIIFCTANDSYLVSMLIREKDAPLDKILKVAKSKIYQPEELTEYRQLICFECGNDITGDCYITEDIGTLWAEHVNCDKGE